MTCRLLCVQRPHTFSLLLLFSTRPLEISITDSESSPRFALLAEDSRAAAAMILGKRPRPPMRRTTSQAQFSAEDLSAAASFEEAEEGSGRHQPHCLRERRRAPPPRRIQRRSLGNSSEEGSLVAAQFLMACGLCNRSLGPGLDTFIYRGEIAFCSQECRELRIKQEEIKEKRLLTATKSDAPSAAAASESAGNGETVVVAA